MVFWGSELAKAVIFCVLIGWAFGLVATMFSPMGLGISVAFGMGLVPALIGICVCAFRRKSGKYGPGYIATTVVGALTIAGQIYVSTAV
jgi:hypothetical protein